MSSLPECILAELKTLLDELQLKNRSVSFESGSKKGDNYLGVITKADIKDNTTDETLHLIIKFAPQLEDFRKYVNIPQLYRREVDFYEHIFEEFISLQKEKNVVPVFHPFPKLYKCSTSAPYEYLILENMLHLGYVMRDRQNTFDLDHCLLVMSSYGKLHALSLALKHHRPDTYIRLRDTVEVPYFACVPQDKLSETLGRCCKGVIKNLDVTRESELIEKLEKFASYPLNGLLDDLRSEKAGEDAVFCHGDSWPNNLLFAYQDLSKLTKPTQVCILDYQLGCCASPAVDLSYFLFVGTDKQMRANHLDLLLQTYHESLISFLDVLDTPTEFSYEALQSHLQQFSRYGLMMSLIVVPLMMTQDDEAPDWNTGIGKPDGTSQYNACTTKKMQEGSVATRLCDIVRDFDQRGYFDSFVIEQAEKLLINEDREYIERRIEEILQRADEKKYD